LATVQFSHSAEQDLFEIAEYTFRTWGKAQTERYLNDFEKCFALLAASPYLGRACDQIRPGLRRLDHKEHVIFYRLLSGKIRISRILHRDMLPI
jgi:toxin ParE1/3/4